MSEQIKKTLFLVACIIAIIVMTVWMWPKYIEDLHRPWTIDVWDEQME